MKRTSILVGIVGVVAALTTYVGAQTPSASDSLKADYDRSNSVRERTSNKVYHQADAPNWIGSSGKFWYRVTVKGGAEFMLVDPASATKAPAFDHAKLAAGINALQRGNVTAITLPFTTFTFADSQGAVEYAPGGAGRAGGGAAAASAVANRIRCSLSDYTCTRVSAPAQGGGAGRAGGGAGQIGRAHV